jgi:hypothetical protein
VEDSASYTENLADEAIRLLPPLSCQADSVVHIIYDVPSVKLHG